VAIVRNLIGGLSGASNQSKTAGTSLTITPTSFTVASGDDLFVVYAGDPAGSAFGVTHAGTATITWSQRKDQLNGSGTSGARTQLWRGTVTGAGTVTSVTISWTTSITAKCVFLMWFSGVGTERATYGVNTTTTVTPITSTASYTTGDLLVFGAAEENTFTGGRFFCDYKNGAAKTSGAVGADNGTTGSGAATNINGAIGWAVSLATQSGDGVLNANMSSTVNTLAELAGVYAPGGPTTWTGAATVSLTDTRTTNGTRKTFGVAVISEADIRQTGGIRTTTSVATVALVAGVAASGARKAISAATVAETVGVTTAGVVTAGVKLGSATVTAVATVTAAGTRTARTASTVTLTANRTTSGTRKTTGVTATPLVANRTTAGRRVALAATTVALTDSRVVAGRLTAKAATATAELVQVGANGTVATGKIGGTSTQLALTISTAGRRTARTTITVTLTDNRTTAGRVGATSSTTTSPVVTVTTLGRRVQLGTSTSDLVDARTTNGRVGARSSSTTPLAATITVAGQRTRLASTTSLLVATITTRGARLQYGTATVGEAVQVTIDSVRQGVTSSDVLLTATVYSTGTAGVPLPAPVLAAPWAGTQAVTAQGRYAITSSGEIRDPDQGVLVGATTGRISNG